MDDLLYNDDVWGPEKGKSANYGRSFEEVNNFFKFWVGT